jgi:hypothetical protein
MAELARSLPPAALPTDFSLGSVLLYGWHRVLLDTTQAAKNFKPQNLRLVPITAAKNVCAVCVAPANSKCAGCGLVWYCTREHQSEDWKSHKRMCLSRKKKGEEKGWSWMAIW